MKFVVLALSLMLGFSSAQAMAFQPDTSVEADAGVGEREALVRRYLAAIDFDQMIVTMNDSLLSSMLSQSGSITPEQSAMIQTSYAEAWEIVSPGYMDEVVALYAGILTLEELSAMVAFYETSLGRSITAKAMILTEQTGRLFQSLSERLMPAFIERMCSRIDCPAD